MKNMSETKCPRCGAPYEESDEPRFIASRAFAENFGQCWSCPYSGNVVYDQAGGGRIEGYECFAPPHLHCSVNGEEWECEGNASDRPLFGLTESDVQIMAEDIAGRPLTDEEIRRVKKGLNADIEGWEEIMAAAIREAVKEHDVD